MPYPKGKKQTKSHIFKRARALIGIKRSKEFKANLRNKRLGKHLSRETIEKIKKNRKWKGMGNINGLGKNLGNNNATGKRIKETNHNWKGGISPKYMAKNAPRPRPEVCEVCGAGGKIGLDHNHKTGAFSGWLCNRFNVELGMVKDNSETLIALADYLNGRIYKYKCDGQDIQPEEKN